VARVRLCWLDLSHLGETMVTEKKGTQDNPKAPGMLPVGALCSNNRLGTVGRVTCLPYLRDGKWHVRILYSHGESEEWIDNLLPLRHI
jgi:hypothetical protein